MEFLVADDSIFLFLQRRFFYCASGCVYRRGQFRLSEPHDASVVWERSSLQHDSSDVLSSEGLHEEHARRDIGDRVFRDMLRWI